MNKFYRVTDAEMEVLASYMDDEIREAVYFRFAPCTNEELLGQVLLRSGISKEAIEEALNIEVSEFEETLSVINFIKDFMYSNNYLNSIKLIYPGRDFVTEKSEKGEDYRLYLDKYIEFLNVLKKIFPGIQILCGVQEYFPEIGHTFIAGRLFYTWCNDIV